MRFYFLKRLSVSKSQMIKQKWLNLLKRILPFSLQNTLRGFRRWIRRIRFKIRHSHGKISNISKEELCAAINRLGLCEGDVTMVYSSLSSLGHIIGGPDTVIDAFLEVLKSSGTLAMPTFPVIGGGLHYLSRDPLFDPKMTPSSVGKLTNVFWKRPGVKRSIHPTHSIAAVGPKAEWLTSDHEFADTPFGNGTPFIKLLESNAWMVCLGVDVHVFTLYHTFEDLAKNFPFDPYMPNRVTARVIDYTGQEKIVTTRVHDPEKARYRIDSHEGVRDVVRKFFQSQGTLAEVKVGDGIIYAMRAQDLWQALNKMLQKGITIYANHCSALKE